MYAAFYYVTITPGVCYLFFLYIVHEKTHLHIIHMSAWFFLFLASLISDNIDSVFPVYKHSNKLKWTWAPPFNVFKTFMLLMWPWIMTPFIRPPFPPTPLWIYLIIFFLAENGHTSMFLVYRYLFWGFLAFMDAPSLSEIKTQMNIMIGLC